MYQIMVDTGAELSVAPRSFADHVQLSSSKSDLELRALEQLAEKSASSEQGQLNS